MSVEQLKALSPAEKYDIFMGRFDYPTVASERNRVSRSDADWEGICHGWAPASLLYLEPGAATLIGADGVRVPFGSGDVKALLTYFHAVVNRGGVRGLGARCRTKLNGRPGSSPECQDVNAGAFHVVLANQLGLRKQGFVADVTRDFEVWNQPVHGFSTRIRGYQKPSLGAAPGTVKEAVVDTTMTYAFEIDPTWNPGVRKDRSKTYTYRLELNNNGQIIGGEWYSLDRPDFLWTQGRRSFSGYYAKIFEVYKASVPDRDETNLARALPQDELNLPDVPDVSRSSSDE
jgi:hypothetical protein